MVQAVNKLSNELKETQKKFFEWKVSKINHNFLTNFQYFKYINLLTNNNNYSKKIMLKLFPLNKLN